MTTQLVEQLIHHAVNAVIDAQMHAGADLSTIEIQLAVCRARERAIKQIRSSLEVHND
jgi:hypothetical protein